MEKSCCILKTNTFIVASAFISYNTFCWRYEELRSFWQRERQRPLKLETIEGIRGGITKKKGQKAHLTRTYLCSSLVFFHFGGTAFEQANHWRIPSQLLSLSLSKAEGRSPSTQLIACLGYPGQGSKPLPTAEAAFSCPNCHMLLGGVPFPPSVLFLVPSSKDVFFRLLFLCLCDVTKVLFTKLFPAWD